MRSIPFQFLCAAVVLWVVIHAQCSVAGPDDRERIPVDGERVTRHFASVSDQQIHYRLAQPESSEALKTPVFALHQSPNSSQVYVEFMSLLATDRMVIAPDTPGFGESDRPLTQPTVETYALAMEGLARGLGLDQVDVVGYHTGASVAVAWALMNPQRVRRLMLVGVPLFNDNERVRMLEQPWPSPKPLDGERVSREWSGSKRWQGAGQSDRSIERTFLAKLGTGAFGWWGAAAVAQYPLESRLGSVSQPLFIVRPRDDLWEITLRAQTHLPDVAMTDLPEYGFGVFEAIPGRMAMLARSGFDN